MNKEHKITSDLKFALVSCYIAVLIFYIIQWVSVDYLSYEIVAIIGYLLLSLASIPLLDLGQKKFWPLIGFLAISIVKLTPQIICQLLQSAKLREVFETILDIGSRKDIVYLVCFFGTNLFILIALVSEIWLFFSSLRRNRRYREEAELQNNTDREKILQSFDIKDDIIFTDEDIKK